MGRRPGENEEHETLERIQQYEHAPGSPPVSGPVPQFSRPASTHFDGSTIRIAARYRERVGIRHLADHAQKRIVDSRC